VGRQIKAIERFLGVEAPDVLAMWELIEPKTHQRPRDEAGGHFAVRRRRPAREPTLRRDVDVDLDISRNRSAARRPFLDMDFELIAPDKSPQWRIGERSPASLLGREAQNTMCRFLDRLKHCNLANSAVSEKSDPTWLSSARARLHMDRFVDVPIEVRADTADVFGRCRQGRHDRGCNECQYK
jgi:hypothetical protein